MELKEIQNLIKFVAKSGVDEVKLQTADFKITIKTTAERKLQTTIQPFPAPAFQPVIPQQVPDGPPPQQGGVETPRETEAKESDSGLITIKSPMIGTFYRSPSPDKDVFVKVGSEIAPGDVVCIVEAMKLFNEIESEVAGKIAKVLVADQSPVEYDQPLFLVNPAKA